jgi:hypothetical protein
MQHIKSHINKLILIFIFIPFLSQAQISPQEAISQMKKGINMGNTLEGPNEGDWGNPPAQEYYFDQYKNEGFEFVRIPTRWDKHLGTTSPFTITESWLNRVEQIVDWGIARGLFIILNSHHDTWIKETYSNPVNQARFDSLWSQIATRFKDKSDHLIFEICNEPVNMTKAQVDEMHKNAIKVIRRTNPTRLIVFQGIDWGGADGLINAAIPDDNYIIGSFHSYDPYLFGLEGQGTWGTTANINALRAKFQTVKNWSEQNNIPVLLGEFGSIKTADYNSRMKHYKTYMELSASFGFAPAAWDDGGDFRIFYRQTKSWDNDVKDILVNSSEFSPAMPHLWLLQDTIVKLGWTNPTAGYDSIFIERKTSGTAYIRVDTLPGNATSFEDSNLPQSKDYYYRVISHYTNAPNLYSYPQKIFLPTYIPVEPPAILPYTGQPLLIPGKVEAEYFDIGGEGFTYHDSDSKNITRELRPDEGVDIYNVGNGVYLVADNYPGEWENYSVEVSQKGQYEITAPIAAFEGGGTFKVTIGNSESEAIVAPTNYSWTKTKPVTFTLNLEAGKQTMRITYLTKPLFNLDYLDFIRAIPDKITPVQQNNQLQIQQTKQELIVRLPEIHPTDQLKIFSITGAEIKTIPIDKTEFRISTSGLHSGIYILQVISEKQKISKKIAIP